MRIVFSSPLAKNRSGRPEVASLRERLSQTPWWNITRSVEGTEPSARTRFGLIRTIQPSTAGFSVIDR